MPFETTVVRAAPAGYETPFLAFAVARGGLPASLAALDRSTDGALGRLFAAGDFSGKRDETTLIYPQGPAERILLVKRRLLEIIVDTMREYGFDVSDLAQQAMTIINNGTMVGAVTGSGIAVGQGASASSVTVNQGAPSK